MSKYNIDDGTTLEMLIQMADLSDDRTSEPVWINVALKKIMANLVAETVLNSVNPLDAPDVPDMAGKAEQKFKDFVVLVMQQQTKHNYRCAVLQGLLASGIPSDRIGLAEKVVTTADPIFMKYLGKLVVPEVITNPVSDSDSDAPGTTVEQELPNTEGEVENVSSNNEDDIVTEDVVVNADDVNDGN